MDFDCDLGIASRGETSDLRYAPAILQRFLKSATFRLRDVPQESENVEQIRLSRGIWTNDELALTQGDVQRSKVSPVFCRQMTDDHELATNESVSPPIILVGGFACEVSPTLRSDCSPDYACSARYRASVLPSTTSSRAHFASRFGYPHLRSRVAHRGPRPAVYTAGRGRRTAGPQACTS